MARKKAVLVVVAHADDLEFMAAGTVARFTQELGYEVYEYILTDNGKGSYRLPARELIAVSAREAVEAGLQLLARKAAYRDILALRGQLQWDDAPTAQVPAHAVHSPPPPPYVAHADATLPAINASAVGSQKSRRK